MKSSRLLVSGLLLAGLLQSPAMLRANTQDDIKSLQRDIAQLEQKVAELKNAEAARMDSLDAQLKQVLDSDAKLSATLAGLQRSLTDTVGAINTNNEQQGKQLLTPMATVSSRVDSMATELSEVKQSVNALTQIIQRFDGRLNELNTTMRTLSAPPPPPPASAGANGAASTSAPNGAPAGFSATATFDNAMKDFYGGKNDLAMEEFRTFLMYAANTDNGPRAYYYMGQIYYRGEQYDEAVKAFDAGLERYPENPTSSDLQFNKAKSLMKADRRAEAIVEFKSFLTKYPNDPNHAGAQGYLDQLTTPVKAPAPHSNSKKR